ncbi:hypothetical protein PsYK624_130090 [Phanerochaete sordida]|uniref:Uncharacterized protein n=1 Tax=Phanerochaete sordida TaxID=48140 RepID=A0A9P3GKX0_9APHY|nr:hypothetical protein PsYK624_130090 [Phanerochaete sordida]
MHNFSTNEAPCRSSLRCKLPTHPACGLQTIRPVVEGKLRIELRTLISCPGCPEVQPGRHLQLSACFPATRRWRTGFVRGAQGDDGDP